MACFHKSVYCYTTEKGLINQMQQDGQPIESCHGSPGGSRPIPMQLHHYALCNMQKILV